MIEEQRHRTVFYGWWIVLASLLCTLLFSGVGFFSFTFFVTPLQDEFGWSRGVVMAGFAVWSLVVAAASPLVGKMVDRYGVKLVISLGAFISGLGLALLSMMSSLWHFYVLYGILGVGLAAMGPIPATGVVSNWFKRHRGIAIGIASTGIGGGGFLLAPLVGYLIGSFGWRTTYLVLGALIWILVIPATLLVMKTKPSDMELLPFGAEAAEKACDKEHPAHGTAAPPKPLASLSFWLISFTYFASGFAIVGILQNQAPYLEDIGVSLGMAATVIGSFGLMSAIGKIIFGLLCDRISAKYASAIGITLQTIGLIILMRISPSTGVGMLWLYAIVLGFGSGSWLPTMSVLVSSNFGLTSYGAVFGMVNLVHYVGTAIGPLMAAFIYDATSTYYWSFTVFLVLYLTAIPAVLAIRAPLKQKSNRS